MNMKITEGMVILGSLEPQSLSSGATRPFDFVKPGDCDRIAFILDVGVTTTILDMKLQLSATPFTAAHGGIGDTGGGTPTDVGTTYAITQISATQDHRIVVIEITAAAYNAALAAVPTKVYIGALVTASGGGAGLISGIIIGRAKTLPAGVSGSRNPLCSETVLEVAGN
jgi:hypothetical protein